jgi:hypothetical protein
VSDVNDNSLDSGVATTSIAALDAPFTALHAPFADRWLQNDLTERRWLPLVVALDLLLR